MMPLFIENLFDLFRKNTPSNELQTMRELVRTNLATARFEYAFAVDTALPQDWLNAAVARLPADLDPRGHLGWGYPKQFSLWGIPVPLDEQGIIILGALARNTA